MKRFLSLFISLILVFTLVPAEVLAETVEPENIVVKLTVGDTATEVEIEAGRVFAQPEDPAAAEGMIFDGWYLQAGEDLSVNPYDFTLPVTEDIELVAVFSAEQPADDEKQEDIEPESIVVKLMVGDTATEVEIEAGQVFEQPEDPAAAEGMIFAGWYLLDGEELSKNPYDFTQPVTEDIELVAVFSAEQPADDVKQEEPELESIVVKLMVGDTATEVEIKAGQVFEQPEDPAAAEGMIFDGWYLLDGEELSKNAYDFTQPVTEDLELVAVFSAEQTAEANIAALAAEGKVAVSFYSNHNLLSTQVILTGTVAKEPIPPVIPAGYRSFLGWYALNADKTFDFNTPIQSDLALYASFSNQYMVKFKDADGIVVHTVMADAGSTIVKPNITLATPPGENQRFVHWYKEGTAQTVAFDFDTAIEENITLLPYFAARYKITFNSSGGTYVNPMWVNSESTATAPTNPVKTGYNFLGWYNGDAAYDFSQPVTSDVDLDARWEPKQVSYQVIYWVEKQNFEGDPGENPDNYIYAHSAFKTALAGSKVNLSASDFSDTSSLPGALPYSEFKFADQNVEIQGNGTSVVNVYFARKVYSLTFNLNNNDAATTMTIGGETYYGNNAQKYALNVKYQQDVTNIWPTSPNATFTRTGNSFVGWNAPSSIDASTWATRRITITSNMLKNTVNGYQLDARWVSNAYEINVKYFAQLLPGEQGGNIETLSSGISYKEMEELTQTIYADSNTINPKTIAGLAHASTSMSGNIIKFYYNRLPFKVQFDPNYGGEASTDVSEILYGSPLSMVEPSAPSLTREDYAFGGWYDNAECKGEPFDFKTKTMPENDLKLFAKWNPSQFTVTFYDSIETDRKDIKKQGVLDSGFADPSGTYQAGQYVANKGIFKNWLCLVDGEYMVFSLDTAIHEDINLFANWKNDEYAIAYDANGGTGTVPVDDSKYKLGVSALVLMSENLVKNGELFAGWQIDGQGKVYYPGNTILVSGNATLKARYLSASQSVEVLYHSNDGTGRDTSHIVSSDESYAAAEKTIFDRDNYEIKYWTLSADDTAPFFTPGETYPLNELGLSGGQINLYAQWKIADKTVTFQAGTGGTLQSKDTDLKYTVPDGTSWADFKSNLPTPVANDGYYFTGWEPKLYGDETLIQQDVTFTANFARQKD